MIRCQKWWQGKEAYLVAHIQLPKSLKTPERKKAYLIIDARSQRLGIKIQEQKPQALRSPGPLVALMRKHLGSCHIRTIVREATMLTIYFSDPGFVLRLGLKNSGVLDLIRCQDKTSLARVSSQGCFTKPMTYDSLTLPEPTPDNTFDAFQGFAAEQSSTTEGSSLDNPSTKTAYSTSQKQLIQSLKRRRKTINKWLHKAQQDCPSQEQIDACTQEARLLQQFSYLITADMFQLHLDSYQSGLDRTYTIELNPEKSPGQNITEAFLKVKKLKKSQQILSSKIHQGEQELAQVETLLTELSQREFQEDECDTLRHKLQIRKPGTKAKPQVAQTYLTFKTEAGLHLLVGKNPHANDTLTKAAKSQDWWFHAVGATGSHVIVAGAKRGREGLSEVTKQQAGILALHFSQKRQDLSGEVYMTQRRCLRKTKGLPPGLWLIDKSETVFIQYSEEELQELLKQRAF